MVAQRRSSTRRSSGPPSPDVSVSGRSISDSICRPATSRHVAGARSDLDRFLRAAAGPANVGPARPSPPTSIPFQGSHSPELSSRSIPRSTREPQRASSRLASTMPTTGWCPACTRRVDDRCRRGDQRSRCRRPRSPTTPTAIRSTSSKHGADATASRAYRATALRQLGSDPRRPGRGARGRRGGRRGGVRRAR